METPFAGEGACELKLEASDDRNVEERRPDYQEMTQYCTVILVA